MKIFIMYPGSANYPEINAYKEFLLLNGASSVVDGNELDFDLLEEKNTYIVWCIMGFYPRRPNCLLLIHDYRSLSIGRFCSIKDQVKRLGNATPNLRIFQNHEMRALMNFNDGVPSLLLPMGVPSWVFDINISREDINSNALTFCYIGEMSRERKFDSVIDAFLRWKKLHAGSEHIFKLVGRPEKYIHDRYANLEGLIFTGKLSQVEALTEVASSDIAVSYFPYHRPHMYQTPTKLLEYAALGARIICNDAPSNIRTAAQLNIPCLTAGSTIFDGLQISDILKLERPSRTKLISTISWNNCIDTSRIGDFLSHACTQ